MQVNLSTVHYVDQYARLNLRRWGYVYIRLVPDAYVHRSKFDDDGEGDTVLSSHAGMIQVPGTV